jgi:PhnB protein
MMAVKPIPEGYHSVTPMLVVEGVDKLIAFLKQAFGAQEKERVARPDGKIMHAEVRIGDSMLMMGEPAGQFKHMPGSFYLYVEDVDSVYRSALDAGATSVMEPADQFYGDRNGGVKDSIGNLWWIATRKEDVAPEELARRAQAATQQRQGA